ncbi:hypothetical protein OAK87_01380 [bacterium]|nr:hypothetical protein [bacterium]
MQNINDELIARQLEREELMQEMGVDRFKRQLEQQERGKDLSRSTPGKVITTLHLEQVINAIREFLNKAKGLNTTRNADVIRAYQRISKTPLMDLDSGEQKLTDKANARTFNPWNIEKTALITLKSLIDICHMPMIDMEDPTNKGKRGGARPSLTTLEIQVGARIEQQIILDHLRHYFPDRLNRLGFISRILKREIKERASYDYKHYNTKRALRETAEWLEGEGKSAMAKLFRWKPWSASERMAVGNKMMRIVIDGLYIEPGVKYFQHIPGPGGKEFLAFTDAGEEFFKAFVEKAEADQLQHLPMLCPPLAHTHDKAGGYYNIYVPQLQRVVTGEWKGQLELSDQHLQFLNNQQEVAFRINPELLAVMEEFYGATGKRRKCGKFNPIPRKEEWVRDIPEHLRHLKKGEEGYNLKRNEKRRVAKEYAIFKEAELDAKQTFTEELMVIGRMYLEEQQWFLPTFSDFRGRTLLRGLGVTYQGTDPHKAILQFAEGYEADERTEHWLRMELTAHMAGGLDKKSYQTRWDHIDSIREIVVACVRDPLGTPWWQDKANVKKNWQWLAAAQEWVRLYVDNDPNRITHHRTSQDATCSGQQYFAGLLRCRKTASQVNLINSEEPADVYSNVLKVMVADLQERAGEVLPLNDKFVATGKPFDPERLANLLSAEGSEIRPGTKACIVSGQYGSGRETRSKGFQRDHEIPDTPFTLEETRGIYQSVVVGLDECLPAMDLILSWIQKVTRDSLEITGRNYIVLPAADGSVAKQLYPVCKKKLVSLDHLGSSKTLKQRDAVLRVPTEQTDGKTQVISSPANLIHAQDGATLVLALHDYDKPFTCTHDSISGRAGKEMDEINQRLLKALHTVFTTANILRRFVELNGLRWVDYKPPIFEADDENYYDPSLVLKANYPYT